jgi:ArsR family transcriptional regulator, arsenate/arsenite/antimonite-responsive transcriptional repressor
MKTMAKVTLDRDAFKALASDTRLDILRCLDGKKMTVTELAGVTNMNKATLHEHLNKLSTVDLIKRVEREGHKWVYYKLSWKGSCLLHPENNRIVIMFSATILALIAGIGGIINYVSSLVHTIPTRDGGMLGAPNKSPEDMNGVLLYTTDQGSNLSTNPYFLYLAIACIIAFIILFIISYKRYRLNKVPKL